MNENYEKNIFKMGLIVKHSINYYRFLFFSE